MSVTSDTKKEKVISRNVTGYKLLKLSKEDRKILLKTMVNDDVTKLNYSLDGLFKNIYKNLSIINILENSDIDKDININIILKHIKLVIPIVTDVPTPKTKKINLDRPILCAIKRKKNYKYVKRVKDVNILGYIIPIINDEKEYLKISEELDNSPVFNISPYNNKIDFKHIKIIDVGNEKMVIEYVKFFIGKHGYKESYKDILNTLEKSKEEDNKRNSIFVESKDYLYGNFVESKRQLMNKVIYERFNISDMENDLSDIDFIENELEFDSNTSTMFNDILYMYYIRLVDSGIFLESDKLKNNSYLFAIEDIFEETIVDYYRYIKNKNLVVDIIRPVIIAICIVAFFIDLHLNKGVLKIDVENNFVKTFKIKKTSKNKNISIVDYYIHFMISLIKNTFPSDYKKMKNAMDINFFGLLKNTYSILISKSQSKIYKKVNITDGILSLPLLDNCFSLEWISPDKFTPKAKDIYLPTSYIIGRGRKKIYISEVFFKNKIDSSRKRNVRIITPNINSFTYKNDDSIVNKIIIDIAKRFKNKRLIKSISMFLNNVNKIGKLETKILEDSSGIDKDELYEFKKIHNEYTDIFYKTAVKELILLFGKGNIIEDNKTKYKYIFYKRVKDIIDKKDKNIRKMYEFISGKIEETKRTDISALSINLKKFKEEEKKEARNHAFYNMSPDEKIKTGFERMTSEEKDKFLDDLIVSQTQGQFLDS